MSDDTSAESAEDLLDRNSVARELARFTHRTAEADGLRVAAVAVALGGAPGDRRMLLTKRPSRLRAHPGQYALPGGGVDPGESAMQACLRELHEELGISAGSADVLGRLDDYVTRSGYVITPFVVWVGDYSSTLRPNEDEVSEVFEVTVDELDVDAQFVSIPESSRPVIRWPYRTGAIHAPTGAIVHQFREVAMHGRHTRVADFEQPVFAWR
ncbi:coenzyme A pyrophosphatase [Rhodococcus sp. 14-2483-1-1]|uniref:NUDIX hydrolase n=1 Tax=Rhodococcus sp. 14-2483-1-1 TaxID=2023148 RepID=UPI000B9B36D8|nr:CoA pyrophosphatase [Rhodococcus sp. 14-2483-1-1]OZF30868.1 coenzyme A pyrophosphatase [Rhodococcus sp. 14-2483-1-1]